MVSETQAWFVDRLKERSTWFGLLSLLSSLGLVMAPEMQSQIIALGTAIGGIVAILTEDKK